MKRIYPIQKERIIVDFSLKGEKRGKAQHDGQETMRQNSLIQRVQKQEQESLGNDNDSFTNQLVNLSGQNDEVLLKIKTVFPLDFFPDTITIDPIKIQITQKYFFLSKTVKSFLVKDIVDTSVETGPLTSTLEIITSEDANHPVRISYLRTSDAEIAMKIIKGLVISLKEAPK